MHVSYIIIFIHNIQTILILMIIKCENCVNNKTKKKKICDIHSFNMKNLQPNLKFKTKTKIKLCPEFNKSVQNYQNIIPRFNNDGKSHMPAFTIQIDQDYFGKAEEKYKKDHEMKINEYNQQKSEIWQPKPNRKNKYCGVCRDNYLQYRDHIKQDNHKDNIHKNKYSQLMLQMCTQFTYKRQREYLLRDSSSKYRLLEVELVTASEESKITV